MADHDPLCRCTDPSWSNPAHCTCEEITNIRADERDRHAAGAWMERIWAQATEAQRDAARAARDAARAEARVAKSEIRILAAFLAEARAEVAALRKQEWAEPYRREVLADLRAKVEGLYVRCTEDPWRNEELTDWVRRDAVLALFDEAQP